VTVSGSAPISGALIGTHTYTLTCSNVSGTRSDTVTVYVIAPLSGTVSPTFARLVLFGPNLSLPAQTLTGTVAGGEPPYLVVVSVRAPYGAVTTYSRSGSAWSLSPSAAEDINFGTTEQGTWTVWADLTDSAGRTFRTNSNTWTVSWYPVHGRP
jgi:PKD repeat protein